MTCILHDYQLVSNHYDSDGNPDTEDFSTGEWRTEKVRRKCPAAFIPFNLKV